MIQPCMTHDTRSEAQILLAAILKFEFFVLLHFWNTILGKLYRSCSEEVARSKHDAAADLKGLQHNLATDGDQLCLDAIENIKISCTDLKGLQHNLATDGDQLCLDAIENIKISCTDLKGLQHNLATDGDQLCLDAIENIKISCTDCMEIDVERRIRRRRRMPDELSLDAGLSAEQEIKRVLRSILDRLHHARDFNTFLAIEF